MTLYEAFTDEIDKLAKYPLAWKLGRGVRSVGQGIKRGKTVGKAKKAAKLLKPVGKAAKEFVRGVRGK